MLNSELPDRERSFAIASILARDTVASEEGFKLCEVAPSCFSNLGLAASRSLDNTPCIDGTQKIRFFRLPVISLRQIKTGRTDMRRLTIGIAFALLTFSNAAIAQDTVKIGYIDPLSGGGASVGEV